jgi:hypothetical protein
MSAANQSSASQIIVSIEKLPYPENGRLDPDQGNAGQGRYPRSAGDKR